MQQLRGMLNPAIAGCAASFFSDSRNVADPPSPAPNCLTWSTSRLTASAICRLPPANWSALLCSWSRFACRPPGWSIPSDFSTPVSFQSPHASVSGGLDGFLCRVVPHLAGQVIDPSRPSWSGVPRTCSNAPRVSLQDSSTSQTGSPRYAVSTGPIHSTMFLAPV